MSAALPRPAIWFVSGETPAAGWSGFASYFTQQGFSCYASSSAPALASAPGLHGSPPAVLAVAHRRVRLPLPAAALAVLAPAPGWLISLAWRPPGSPVWLGLGQQATLSRWAAHLALRRLHPGSIHVFEGLGAGLLSTAGWERVAHALRLWTLDLVTSGTLDRPETHAPVRH